MANDVFVKLKLDSQEFDRGLTRSTKKVDAFDGEVKKSDKLLSGWTGAMTAFGASALIAGTALIKMTNAMAENVFEAERYANRLGISTKELLNLQSAAKDFGVEAEDVSEGLKNMTERLGEAFLEGKGATFDALTKLGINLKEIEALDTNERLFELAGALSRVESEAERTFLTMEIFQEEGFKMGEMLALGEIGLRDYVDAQNKFTDSIDIEGLKLYRKQVSELTKTFESGGHIIASTFVSALTSVNKEINDFAAGLFGVFKDDVALLGINQNLKDMEIKLKALKKVGLIGGLDADEYKKLQAEQELLILNRNKLEEKTTAEYEKQFALIRKINSEKIGIFEGIFSGVMEGVIDATNKQAQADFVDIGGGVPGGTLGLLERGSQEEIRSKRGDENDLQKQQTAFLKELVALNKKRKKQFVINEVNF